MLSSKAGLKSELPFENPTLLSRSSASAHSKSERSIEIFSTCPQSLGFDKESYVRQIRKVARWSERCGCTGVLVYTDNSLVDPWLVSQIIVESTEALSPLVAIQPVYMHPY
ncbi:MAG TPA: hypothetical protein VE778_02615, partial [Candidatus Bathyarchaeia archaeon]|nr:hypothetical protein [Candidatus Bathyarchaeia archaeon]